MKHTYFLFMLFSFGIIHAQSSFSDDFESYTVGSKLGPQSAQWTTWSGADGGTEDVNVVSTGAHSGTKSIYFSSTATNGGPNDVILPFGGQYNTGTFEFSAYFNVQSGKGAYFNFQAESTPGNAWTLDCFMDNTGGLSIQNSTEGTVLLSTTYSLATWFQLKISADLNTNLWELFIDNVSKGTFQTSAGQLASMDIYPLNGNGFWIDDVSYNHTSFTLPSTNGAAFILNPNAVIAGQSGTPSASIRNLGTSAITSFNLSILYNGNTITKNVSGVSIPSMGSYSVDFSNTLTLVPGNNPMTLTISAVNGGGSDGNVADDSKTINIDPIVPAVGKIVAVEEATGTWCQWCPRGAVFMDRLSDKYGQFYAGIAVHNNDPMEVSTYDAGVGTFINGYPSALVERGSDIDPSTIEAPFLTALTTAPVATMEHSATLVGSTLTVNVTTTYQQNGTGPYTVACVLTEDNVTGTASGYAQSNAYAGGGSGVMGGFEALPNPVPASQMVYNHVGRDIQPSFTGTQGTLPTSFTSGSQYTNTITFTLNSGWDVNEMHIVSLHIASDGTIDNAGYTTLNDALAVTSKEIQDRVFVTLYPNPSSDLAYVRIKTNSNKPVSVSIRNSFGQLISSKNYGVLEGKVDLPLQTSHLIKGVYFVEIQDGYQVYTKTLIVQ